MIKSSTGLANSMLVTAPFVTTMNLCVLKIFSGDAPTTADLIESGTLLLTITNASTATGLTWEATTTDRNARKKASETWSGVVGTAGVAGYFRLVLPADDGTESAIFPRLQGSVGNGALSDLFFSNPTLVLGETKTLSAFSVELPTN